MRIGNRIRRWRPGTQGELAEAAGISRNTVSMIEVGKTEPSLRIFEALCKALKVTPNELLGWDEK